MYLLAGVCSDELVEQYKFKSVMGHAERCEAVRHCRWVDEIVPDAPWVIDATFLAKYNIDYVAHDDEPYVSAGHEDVYGFAKSIGSSAPCLGAFKYPDSPQANLYQHVARRVFRQVCFWRG